MTLDQLRPLVWKVKPRILEEYFTFLRFPSISTEGEFKPKLLACVSWLDQYLTAMGFDVEVWPTVGHPVLFASYLKAGKDKPTLLFYNHYDVQPADPVSEWESPPFEPTVRGNNVFARGAQDNKGQCWSVIQALRILLERDGTLPINIKLCIEGEEEAGSEGLHDILPSKKEELKADYLAVVDVGIPDMTTPAISLGVRGIVTFDVEFEGSKGDLHSGEHGGVVYNPLHALVEVLSKLHDPETGRVAIPGFYDDVIEQSKEELHSHFDEKLYEVHFGKPTGGEKAYSPLEREWLRPTIEINGVTGGYAGKGFKTVIPAQASAKLSCRLVSNQDPKKISALVIQFLEENCPPGITLRAYQRKGVGKPTRVSANSPLIKAFATAYSEAFRSPCRYILTGGSIPVAVDLADAAGADLAFVGLGLPTDNIHAPNEHYGLDRLEKGILIIARAIEELGK